MKRTLFLAAAALIGLSLTASGAAAQERDQYLQANLGVGVGGNTHVSLDIPGFVSGSGDFSPKTGFFASVVSGKRFAHDFAVEAEGVYTNNDIDSGNLDKLVGGSSKASVETFGGLVNLIYNVPLHAPVTPYAGVGVGYGAARYQMVGASETQGNFLWQVKAGVTYPVTKEVTLDFGYRYMETPDFKSTGSADGISATLKAQTNLHILSVGARMSF